jgi:hypothetical protein
LYVLFHDPVEQFTIPGSLLRDATEMFLTIYNYLISIYLKGNELYYYWDTTTSSCKIKGTIAATCSCPTFSTTNSQCNTTLNLACYVGSACSGGSNGNQYTTTACNCATYSTGVTTSTFGRCDCK